MIKPAQIKATLKNLGITAFVRNTSAKNMFKIRVEGENKVEREFTADELKRVSTLVDCLGGVCQNGDKLESYNYFNGSVEFIIF